jgi:protochlorophyllide reductase
VAKAKEVAEELELSKESYTIMQARRRAAKTHLGLGCTHTRAHANTQALYAARYGRAHALTPHATRRTQVDLDSLDSVSNFAGAVLKLGKRIDVLVCNAAVYLPNQEQPSFTKEGYEMSFGVNHLAHHLLVRKLLPELKKTKGSRCIIVGSITGNSNTVGGGAVLPLADLGGLKGLEAGGKRPIAMLDGKAFNGAKAYKDAKLCNMMTVLELHRRYNASTGVAFTSMYPGCIAETALFRQKRGWFRWLFPLFMKYVTGGYVSEGEAGERLAQTVSDPACAKSGVYWSWNGGAKTVGWFDFSKKQVVGAGGAGGSVFENEPSDLVRDEVNAAKLFELCDQAVAPWLASAPAAPKAKAAVAA